MHDIRLVVLAGLLCFFACFTAMSMISRAQLAKGRLQITWLVAAGFSAGSGIWATHFVAMLAYKTSFAIGYNSELTILSAIVAITFSGVGYWLSMGRAGPVWGGIVVGAGIGAMHYVGMAAVEIQAYAIWDPIYVAASVLLGILLTMPAMVLATRDVTWRSMLAGATLFTLAIVGMHFTSMSALTYRPDPLVNVPDGIMQPVALAVAVAAFAIIALGLIGSLVDNSLEQQASGEAQRLRRYIEELEATKHDLLVAKNDAEAGNRAKSNFLANMSHELRTPLNAVIGFTDLIRQQVLGPIAPVKYGEYIEDVHHSAKHLLNLINDILDLAKIEGGHWELEMRPLDPSCLVKQAVGFVQPQATIAQVDVSADIDAMGALIGDERAMVQILTNLLSNAVKFSRPRDRVRLFVRKAGGKLALGVEDEGIGMSSEGLKKALEPFGQATAMETIEGSGTGLGLPIVKALVEAQGGMFRLESQINKGTRAWAEFAGPAEPALAV